MFALAIQTPIFRQGDDAIAIILKSLREHKVELEDRDVLAISSKMLATTEMRIIPLEEVIPSKEAKELADKYSLEPEFAEVVLRESERIYGGVYKSILTLKNGILTVNAGVDNKNAPENSAALWPSNLQGLADRIRKEIKRRSGRSVGIVIVDSQLAPLRMGTQGLALAVSGFKPTKDCRGKRDLFQKPLVITYHSIADDLASAAHLLMGETSEQTPVVIFKDAPITFVESVDEREMKISPEECVFMNTFLSSNQT